MHSAERAIAELVRSSELDPTTLRTQFAAFLWGANGDFPASARADPHALGWLHQYLAEDSRQRSFQAHTRDETKHSSDFLTTQLYTPRWVAHWLVARCFDQVGTPMSVLDPACGGGQMLLVAAEQLVGAGVDPATAYSLLRGVDLDPDAVWACRESLKLAAARALGHRDEALEAGIDRNVVEGDGLSPDVAPAQVVITNPPYMGSRSMPGALKASIASFAPFHHDLYLAFVKRCSELATGVMGVLAQQTIWYLKRFEAARTELLGRGDLLDFAHLGHGVFDALNGEKATVVAFTWRPGCRDGQTRFWDARDADDKAAALDLPPIQRRAADFAAIPAAPLAFWLPPNLVEAFDGPKLGDIATVPGSQNKTGNNARYVKPIAEAPPDWVPYSKGGRFAPWWGNWDWAVDWSEEARAFYAGNRTSNLLSERWWFREGLCYADFGGRHFNARWMPPGCVFDMAGPAIFVEGDDSELLAALLVVLNSTPARTILNALNPTLHFQVRDVRNLPLCRWDTRTIAELATFGRELVDATRLALEGDGGHPFELELAADRLVADAYGCPDLVTPLGSRRAHHRLSRKA